MSVISDARHARANGRKAAAIFISDGDKGGVGKSFLARILAHLVTNAGHSWAGIDLDARNGHLQRFHGEHQVERFDWTKPAEWNRAYDRIIDVDASQTVLIDLPAQAGTVLAREFPRLLATATSMARPVLRFWSVAREFDSVNLLHQTLGMVECRNTIAVLNLRGGKPDNFNLWLNSKTRGKLLQEGGLELSLPLLPSGVAEAIEEADLSFSEALRHLKQPYYHYDLEAFFAEINREFAPVMERLA